MNDKLAVQETQGIAYRHELSVDEVIAQVEKIQQVTRRAMEDGVHYGKIPGTPKPTLLKAGAEKLCLTFRLDPQYATTEDYDGRHLTVKSICALYHIPTGQRMGSGEGSCSTKESKYAYRQQKRACPKCGAEAIIRSKYPPRNRRDEAPGWWCNPKGGGCGEDFSADDTSITEQQTGRTDNPDLPDQYNTVLKMANKRSLVAAVLNVTAASDIFTQDMEDFAAGEDSHHERPASQPQGHREPAESGSVTAPVAEATVLISEGQQRKLWAVARGHGWGDTEQEIETAVHDVLAARMIASVKGISADEYDDILTVLKAGPKK